MKKTGRILCLIAVSVTLAASRCHHPTPSVADVHMAPGVVGTSDEPLMKEVVAAFDHADAAVRHADLDALMDAMLEHSRGLGIGASEWLTVAARRRDDRTSLGVDTDSRTVVLSVRGADLAAFLGGQITPQEARNRVEVRVF